MQQSNVQQPQPQFTFEGGHLVMFHQESTGLPKVQDANVNDRDRIIDLLAQEKYLSGVYNSSILEASHDQLVQVLHQNQDTVHHLQRSLFNTAFKKGWYRMPVAEAQALFSVYNDAQKSKSEFPFPTSGTQQTSQAAQVGGTDQQLHQQVQQALAQATQATQASRKPH